MTNIETTVQRVQSELTELFDENAGNNKRGEIDGSLGKARSNKNKTNEQLTDEAYDRAMKGI